MNVTKFHCPTCKSVGFKPSKLKNRCTFCDGTEGGHPPTQDEIWSDLVFQQEKELKHL